MRVLTKIIETYEVEDQDAAADLIQEFRDNETTGKYTVAKTGTVDRNKKEKGIIVSRWCVVTIQKNFIADDEE